MLSIVVAVVLSAGCEKDTDCKGDRICEAGRCVSPAAPPASAPPAATPPPLVSEPPPPAVSDPPPPPQTTVDPSKVYRLNGQLCRDSINEQGVVQRDCVSGTTRPQPRKALASQTDPSWEPEERPRKKTRGDEPIARGVGDVVAQGGFGAIASTAGNALYGILGFSLSGGAVFQRPGVGLVGVLIGHFSPFPQGTLQAWTFGPAVRFGTTHHLTLGIMPTLTAVPQTLTTSNIGLSGSIVVQAAAVWGHFTLMAQPLLHFDASGVIFALTGALGVAF